MRFSDHCRCAEVTVVERLNKSECSGLDRPPGQKWVAVAEKWPLEEVRL